MRIKSEDEVLDPGVRAKIIEEIQGKENMDRKAKHYKRHMTYRDYTYWFVIEELEKQFDRSTVAEMSYAIPNISISRKIIEKLSRVYSNGVQRTAVDEEGTDLPDETNKVQRLEKILQVNQKQKTVNRYLKLHKNVDCYVKPCPKEDGTYEVILQPLAPFLYDVVEDYYDRTKPLVYVMSYYKYQQVLYSTQDVSKEGRSFDQFVKPPIGDGKDQIIADNPVDQNAESKEFIWWSDKYHFTTNDKGEVISESTENPIGIKPFISYALEQDNAFWSITGDDLTQTSIKINTQLAHINHIGVVQGYGQAFFKGKNPPRNLVVGPNKIIVMEYEENDPVPDFGFATANPPLASLMAVVEMQTALLLTTNNLSTSGVSTNMANGANFSSGIALIIDKAESMEDVKDQQQIFLDKEQQMWDVINKWLMYYGSTNELSDEYKELIMPEDVELNIQFNQSPMIMTEKEKLENIQLRKDLGLNTQAELIKLDQPDLTDEQAEEKLQKIMEEKQAKMDAMKAVVNKANQASQDTTNAQGDVTSASQEDNGIQSEANLGN